MGTSAAPIGAGTTAAGTAINAYGQHQGLSAINDAINRQTGAQRGFDQQLQGRTQQLIAGINPATLFNTAGAQQLQGKTDAAATNTASAVAALRARKGAAGGPEQAAQQGQQLHAVLAGALQDSHVQAALRALTSGQQNIDLLGRQYAGDAGRIRGDATQWGNLLPLQEQAAGQAGSATRQIGTLFNTVGQGAMSYGMAQPTNPWQQPAPNYSTSAPNAADTRRPVVDPLTGRAQA